jgi:hypothetical protein
MQLFSKKINFLTPYRFLLLFLQNQKNKNRKNYDINEETSANKHKIKYIEIAILLFYSCTNFSTVNPFMGYPIKNKFAKRRVCGVERFVGLDRRGNLGTDRLFRAIFIVKNLKNSTMVKTTK